jgi:hypothetical protein
MESLTPHLYDTVDRDRYQSRGTEKEPHSPICAPSRMKIRNAMVKSRREETTVQ